MAIQLLKSSSCWVLQILQKCIGILLDFDSGLVRGMKGLELSTEQRKVLRDYGC